MKFRNQHTFSDLLEGGPVVVDGLAIDTHVEVVVTRFDDGSFEIDSSNFGEKDIYVMSDNDITRVKVGRDGNHDFLRRVESAVDLLALKKAAAFTGWD